MSRSTELFHACDTADIVQDAPALSAAVGAMSHAGEPAGGRDGPDSKNAVPKGSTKDATVKVKCETKVARWLTQYFGLFGLGPKLAENTKLLQASLKAIEDPEVVTDKMLSDLKTLVLMCAASEDSDIQRAGEAPSLSLSIPSPWDPSRGFSCLPSASAASARSWTIVRTATHASKRGLTVPGSLFGSRFILRSFPVGAQVGGRRTRL